MLRPIHAVIVYDPDQLSHSPGISSCSPRKGSAVSGNYSSYRIRVLPPLRPRKRLKPAQHKLFITLSVDHNSTTTRVKFGDIQQHDVRVSMAETADHSRLWSTRQSQVA